MDGIVLATREDAAIAFSTAHQRRHKVARCRWCHGPFVWVYERHWLCASEACALRQLNGAIRRTTDTYTESPFLYLPLPVQIDVEENTTPNLLIAGAAGTSKSYGARWLAYKFCQRIAGARVLLLRLSYDQLQKNHLQYMPAEARSLGARFAGGSVRQMTFPNGSIISAGYCWHESDIPQHVGPEWDLIIFEEGVMFLPKALEEISSRARGSEPARVAMMAAGYTAGFVRILSNPGGRAMLYLSDAYITKAVDPQEYPEYVAANFGHLSTTLDDNPYLAEHYVQTNLSHLSASRFKQLRYGDWGVYVGQFFDFEAGVHVQPVDVGL